MGHGVVEGNFLEGRWSGGIGTEVGHAVGEGGGNGEAAGVGVVFHVVLRGMGQYNVRGDLVYDGGQFSKMGKVVEDFQVIGERWVPGGP